MKPPEGDMRCTYCGAENPDSEQVCPNTGGRHSLISASDKQELGQGRGPGPGNDSKPFERSDLAKAAHGFAQTDTVKHCPFCGSGDVWGGSDGTITCEFCAATFQVSVEPAYPSAPGSIDGNPLNMEGDPDAMGQADAGDALAGAEGVAPGQQGPPGMPPEEGEEGPPGAEGEEEEPPEDEEGGGGPPPFPPKGSSRRYLTAAGDRLGEYLYLKHLAIRHAEDEGSLLTEMRHTRVMAAQDPTRGRGGKFVPALKPGLPKPTERNRRWERNRNDPDHQHDWADIDTEGYEQQQCSRCGGIRTKRPQDGSWVE